jgi:hypothetical protein
MRTRFEALARQAATERRAGSPQAKTVPISSSLVKDMRFAYLIYHIGLERMQCLNGS